MKNENDWMLNWSRIKDQQIRYVCLVCLVCVELFFFSFSRFVHLVSVIDFSSNEKILITNHHWGGVCAEFFIDEIPNFPNRKKTMDTCSMMNEIIAKQSIRMFFGRSVCPSFWFANIVGWLNLICNKFSFFSDSIPGSRFPKKRKHFFVWPINKSRGLNNVFH